MIIGDVHCFSEVFALYFQTLEDVFLKLSEQQELQLRKGVAKGASIVRSLCWLSSVLLIVITIATSQ